MIIHLNEHRFGRLFLTESKNGDKAHKRTREVLAEYYNLSPDDEKVIDTEIKFRKNCFGEGLMADWFITIEPMACK